MRVNFWLIKARQKFLIFRSLKILYFKRCASIHVPVLSTLFPLPYIMLMTFNIPGFVQTFCQDSKNFAFHQNCTIHGRGWTKSFTARNKNNVRSHQHFGWEGIKFMKLVYIPSYFFELKWHTKESHWTCKSKTFHKVR